MTKFSQLVLVSSIAAFASVAGAQEVYNWRNASGEVWKSASGECWRSAAWTPATAAAGCDGAIAPKAPEAAPVVQAPVAAPVVAAPTPAVVVPVAPVAEKVSYSAETLFAFDKSVLTPKAKAELDGLIAKLKS